uniref:Cyclin_C domain-containing protein n=1 Tax=Ascaris lumbricoides TaxID=6252 RepID=A0A0M3HTK6_ASCLU
MLANFQIVELTVALDDDRIRAAAIVAEALQWSTGGNPFSDAQWIPVLDMCTIECDQLSELCVGDEQLKQQCNKLPEGCIRMLKSMEKKSKRIYNRGMDRAKLRTVPLLTKRKPNSRVENVFASITIGDWEEEWAMSRTNEKNGSLCVITLQESDRVCLNDFYILIFFSATDKKS